VARGGGAGVCAEEGRLVCCAAGGGAGNVWDRMQYYVVAVECK
jgi:hypothetical protein